MPSQMKEQKLWQCLYHLKKNIKKNLISIHLSKITFTINKKEKKRRKRHKR
jgi:hypothetical protein